VENPGMDDDDFANNVNPDNEGDADTDGNPTESELFCLTEDQGHAQSIQLHPMRPRRANYDSHSSYVTSQMSAKKGLQVFGND
jgi:hypothetical protein